MERRGMLGMPEEKRPLGRHRRRWDDNIKMDLSVIGCGGIDWIYLAQDRDLWRPLVNMIMNLRVSYNVGSVWRLLKKDSAQWS
jgi:hypothetical protein